jgi:hypothetical protein
MNSKTICLFVLLILLLVLCSFLGGSSNEGFTSNTYQTDQGGAAKTISTDQGNTYAVGQGSQGNVATASNINGNKAATTYTAGDYDNYNHYTGTSYPTIFYGPNGGTARVIQTGNDVTIVTTDVNGVTQTFYISNDPNNTNTNTFYGPNGAVATFITTDDGKKALSITYTDGTKVIYTVDNPVNTTSQDDTINSTYETNQYYGSNGGQAATISGPQGNTAGYVKGPNGNIYYGSNYYDSTDPSATTVSGPQGNSATVVTGPGGNTYASANYSNSSDYYNSLQTGIPASQIPAGQEDLYILKSQVVPPVCPMCPEPIVQCPNDFDASKCPPCPPCARCPEPSFDCKKVPNYNAFNQDYLPVPVLNDFSSFGS